MHTLITFAIPEIMLNWLTSTDLVHKKPEERKKRRASGPGELSETKISILCWNEGNETKKKCEAKTKMNGFSSEWEKSANNNNNNNHNNKLINF